MTTAVMRIPLAVPPWGDEEINEAIDSLKSGMLTMGSKVKRFEQAWADYIGVKHAVMTNSGSSANLLALSALGLPAGSEVITPALTWATTVFPIAQVGLVPVLVDVDPLTYNIDPLAVEAAITPKTRAIMPVHLLGNPCDMDAIVSIVQRYNLLMVEDCCEAHGAQHRGSHVGVDGNLATFSFFFSHHVSTIEGGMVLTNYDAMADNLRGMRAFGWVRDRSDKAGIIRAHPEIDPRFLFSTPGYNVRPTEIGGAFGIHQVPKLEGYIAIRRENAAYWNKALSVYSQWLQLPEERPGTRHVSFAYAVTVKEGAPFTKQEFQDYLESRGVETRQIEAGCMSLQPAMASLNYRAGPLPNAEYIHHNGFFWGNNHAIGAPERAAVVGYVEEFMKARGL